MAHEVLVEKFFEVLINGDRPGARQLIREHFQRAVTAPKLLTHLLWPTHELVERLYRSDQLTRLSYHLATRLLRVLTDQTAAHLVQEPRNGHTVFACCGTSEGEELGAQMAVDLLEAAGFQVSFAGGGIPADEILTQVHETRPDTLLMFASAPSDLPGIRQIIDQLREINAVPNTQVVVGGGVFSRAEGLAEEIGAEMCAADPFELVEMLKDQPVRAARVVRRLTVDQSVRRAA